MLPSLQLVVVSTVVSCCWEDRGILVHFSEEPGEIVRMYFRGVYRVCCMSANYEGSVGGQCK